MLFKTGDSYVKIIVIFFIVVLVIPLAVNQLMGINITTVHGGTDTWITFLGSYIGSLLSGLLTFVGVLLTLEFTKNQRRKDILPEKLTNTEDCIDFVDEVLDEIEYVQRVDVEEVLTVRFEERKAKLFEINDSYQLINKQNMENITTSYLKEIRNRTVKIDETGYSSYLLLKENVSMAYQEHIQPLKEKFSSFHINIMDGYVDSHPLSIIMNDGKLTDIDISSEEIKELRKLKTELHSKEREYLSSIEDAYDKFSWKLENILHTLNKEYT